MSFRCGVCGEPQKAGTKPHKVFVKIRKVVYIHEGVSGNPETTGFEPEEEKLFCPKCAKDHLSTFQPVIAEKTKRISMKAVSGKKSEKTNKK